MKHDRPWDEISEEERRTSYADWRRNGSVGNFADKEELVRSYARHLLSQGEKPTRKRIEDMLESTGRGYSRSRTHLSQALRGGPDGKWFDLTPLKFPNSRPVIANGKPYHSIRAAAEGEGCAVETVRNRIHAGRGGWRYAD